MAAMTRDDPRRTVAVEIGHLGRGQRFAHATVRVPTDELGVEYPKVSARVLRKVVREIDAPTAQEALAALEAHLAFALSDVQNLRRELGDETAPAPTFTVERIRDAMTRAEDPYARLAGVTLLDRLISALLE